jgi:REP element-mobilizing transposase RayT
MPDHHRRSIRLPGYDYSQPGNYYLTMVTYHRESIFGVVDGNRVRLSPFGQIARDCWKEIPSHFQNTELGPFVVMPNHFHGIINIVSEINGRGTACRAPTHDRAPTIEMVERFGKPVPGSIPTIVRAYKSAVTKRINELRGTPNSPVWQRNYFERIIQTDEAYLNIATYIEFNPENWLKDDEYVMPR